MSVKIEILDYVLGDGVSIVDVNAGTPQTGWSLISNKSASFIGDGTNNVKYYNDISLDVISGKTYKIRFQISGYSGTGNIGFSQGDSGGTSLGITTAARISSNGTITETFTAIATGKVRVFSRGTVTIATMFNISVLDASGVDWDNSIVGELDITDHSDFPLALTFQISDFKDLTSTSGDYSKSFKIPATKNNNNILKHLYIPNLIVDNKVTDKKPCRILFNNLYSLVGLLQVDGVGGYGETPSYYNCVFFGSNLSWADKIQDVYMNTIDWGNEGEALTYNKNSITATWQHEDCDNLSNSPIVYPITSYGDYNPEGIDRTIQLLDTAYNNTGGSVGKIGYYGFFNDGDSYETPAPVADWRPSVFVKPTLDKIFSQLGGGFGTLGYTINSAFMETDMFKKLVWLLPNFKYNNPDDRIIKYSYGNRFENEGLIDSILVAPTNDATAFPTLYQTTDTVLDLNDSSDFVLNSNTDNTGWDANTGIFTAQEFGNYQTKLNNFGFYWEQTVYNLGSLNVEYVRLNVQVKTAGQTSWNTVDFSESNSFTLTGSGTSYGSLTFPNMTSERFLNKNDQLRINVEVKARTIAYSGNQLTLYIFGSSSPTSATSSDNANAMYTIELDPFNVEYGQTYNLKDVINSNYKQTDFIKGIAHAFNLKMTTNESTRTVNIEPFDSFYKPYGEAIDWTYKLNRSSQTSDKWLDSDLKRTLVFKYKSDGKDAKVESRSPLFDDIKDEYPYRETLPNTFKKGDSTFENPFFAGTFNAKDQDTVMNNPLDTAYSACLWTENVNQNSLGRPNKGNEFLPRLLYWNKYSSTAGLNQTSKFAMAQTWTSDTEFIIASINYPALSNIYPQATMLNRDSTTSPNLAYGNAWVRDYDDTTTEYTSYQTGKGLYDTYYRNMIEGLKRSPRLRTVSLSLNITDIVNLDFTKLVYIDGVYWRISKIIDYKPNKNESTKVELIEWFQVGVFAATAPSFGQGGDSGWSEDGSSTDDSNDNMGL